MAKMVAVFVKDEEKKHSIRFKEQGDEGTQILGTAYIKRSALKQLDNANGEKPIALTIEVEANDE